MYIMYLEVLVNSFSHSHEACNLAYKHPPHVNEWNKGDGGLKMKGQPVLKCILSVPIAVFFQNKKICNRRYKNIPGRNIKFHRIVIHMYIRNVLQYFPGNPFYALRPRLCSIAFEMNAYTSVSPLYPPRSTFLHSIPAQVRRWIAVLGEVHFAKTRSTTEGGHGRGKRSREPVEIAN